VISQRPIGPRTIQRGNISHPIWLDTPMIVMIDSTTPSAPTWIGIRKTSAGITTAPVSASHG